MIGHRLPLTSGTAKRQDHSDDSSDTIHHGSDKATFITVAIPVMMERTLHLVMGAIASALTEAALSQVNGRANSSTSGTAIEQHDHW